MIEDSNVRVDEDHLDADGELVTFNGKPFTGIGFDPFPGGEGVEYETEYKNGLAHGLRRKSNVYGQLEYEVSCYEGVKHGEETHWFPDGAVKLKAIYEYGIKVSSRSWDKDGKLDNEFIISPDSTNFALLVERRKKGWGMSEQ
jgi:antitoxin component YwqK of YwqJK toxin-antitoxin module